MTREERLFDLYKTIYGEKHVPVKVKRNLNKVAILLFGSMDKFYANFREWRESPQPSPEPEAEHVAEKGEGKREQGQYYSVDAIVDGIVIDNFLGTKYSRAKAMQGEFVEKHPNAKVTFEIVNESDLMKPKQASPEPEAEPKENSELGIRNDELKAKKENSELSIQNSELKNDGLGSLGILEEVYSEVME